VAHVCSTAGATGVEAHLWTLLSSFAPERVVPVLFGPGAGPLVPRLEARGVRVEAGAPTSKLAFGAAGALAERWRGRFDVVHAHGPRAMFWAAPAARRARLPLVITVHELRWQTLPRGWKRELWIALEGRSLHAADRIITVSDATRRDMIARWPKLANRARVVYAAAPMMMDPHIPSADPGRRDGGPLRLVTVGRFDWQKGYDLLLPALAALAAREVPFTIDIVGHGTLEPELRERAKALGIADRIRWRGRDVDVPALHAQSHAFVTTTRAEMFGIAVLEAMACGLPVLATAVGSLLEVVKDGQDGELLPFEPAVTLPERVADRLAAWWNDSARMARMGATGRRDARERFSPAAFATATEAVYRELPGVPPGVDPKRATAPVPS
jgi:glycosyltransferase involved in cell wall biosynthesis